MSHSEQMNELVAALSKGQAAMKPAKFDSVNPHFKSRYASYTSVVEACKPLFAQGLSFTHQVAVSQDGNFWVCVTTLWHTSGQWISSSYPLPAFTTQHKFASDYTYAKRYTLCGLAGIAADEDDDANEAQKAPKPEPTAAPNDVIKAMAERYSPPPIAKPVDTGEPREITLGDSPDWAWFGRQMVDVSTSEKWPDWRAANLINMERMKSESPKVYALMSAQLQKARG